MNPKYPIFIPTKGRWKTPYTIDTFKYMKVPFTIVVEPQEFEEYSKIVSPENILVTPHSNKGLIETRNFIWDYCEKQGYERFWTFDDNIKLLFRLNLNNKIPVSDGTCLKVIEDFADRYENLYLTGMHYFMFAPKKTKIPPIYLNTRVYSNMLLKTDARDSKGKKFRNELFYNDDTDLCLRMLKDGLPIVLFNAFLIDKQVTMTVSGGMTEYYKSAECDGRKKFVKMLVDAHPDVARLTWKFGRWHHQVDYSPFKGNKLILKKGLKFENKPNNYGMKLVYLNDQPK